MAIGGQRPTKGTRPTCMKKINTNQGGEGAHVPLFTYSSLFGQGHGPAVWTHNFSLGQWGRAILAGVVHNGHKNCCFSTIAPSLDLDFALNSWANLFFVGSMNPRRQSRWTSKRQLIVCDQGRNETRNWRETQSKTSFNCSPRSVSFKVKLCASVSKGDFL